MGGLHENGVGGGHRLNNKKQQRKNQKTWGLGHEWCIYVTGSNYPALLSSSETLAGVWVHFLDGTTCAKEGDKIPEEFH